MSFEENKCIVCGDDLDYLFTYCHWCGAAQHKLEPSQIAPNMCPDCLGCGNVQVSHAIQCYKCEGTGKVRK
jgi:DnaJ-class molecular chaperone